MAHYQGSSSEGTKARTLAAEREEQALEFKRKQEEIKRANEVKLLNMNDVFQSRQNTTEEQFKASTVGLVSASDFKKKRLELEEAQIAAEKEKAKAAEKMRKRKGREREQKMKALSFSMDDEEEALASVGASSATADHKSSASSDSSAAANSTDSTAAASSTPATASTSASTSTSDSNGAPPSPTLEPSSKKIKTDDGATSSSALPVASGKDPLADTSFLPDRAREMEEAALRAALADQWKKEQELVKQEQIQIVYSYWDGSGHRNKVVVTKGMTIGQFLEKARKEIVHQFPELRGLGGESLIYIKEDLIIPHSYSFYDLIVTKARGKCYAPNTRVLTYDGRVKCIAELQPGIDRLIGEDSQPRHVKSVVIGGQTMADEEVMHKSERASAAPMPQMCRIETTNGTVAPHLCNGDHTLVLQSIDTEKRIEVSVNEFLTWPAADQKRWTLATPRRVVQFEAHHLRASNEQSQPRSLADRLASIVHTDCAALLRETAWLVGIYMVNRLGVTSSSLSLNVESVSPLVSDRLTRWANLVRDTYEQDPITVFQQLLSSYDLLASAPSTYIPFDLLTESEQVRSHLMAGIIDATTSVSLTQSTPATVASIDLSSIERTIASGIIFIARSLGLHTRRIQSKSSETDAEGDRLLITGRNFHSFPFTASLLDVPSNSPIAAAPIDDSHLVVTPVGHGSYTSLVVEGNDHKFLLADLSIGHNSGPLFHFDVHDDVRMTIDASIEKDESHAGKVVTKGWYERNKNNFPASRWEVFDPAVIREKYSIKGGEVRGAKK